jgi:hypothetical protein
MRQTALLTAEMEKMSIRDGETQERHGESAGTATAYHGDKIVKNFRTEAGSKNDIKGTAWAPQATQ